MISSNIYKKGGITTEDDKNVIPKIKKYLKIMADKQKDIPTLAGLAVYLGLPKSRLLKLEDSDDPKLRDAFLRAKNIIEHTILSKSAYKEISSTMARFYLTSPDFISGNGENRSDFSDISIFVEEE